MAHGHFGGNDELIEWFRFKHMLRELIGKTLQLSIAPKVAMSLFSRHLPFTTSILVQIPPLEFQNLHCVHPGEGR